MITNDALMLGDALQGVNSPTGLMSIFPLLKQQDRF